MKVAEFIEKLGMLPRDAELLFEAVEGYFRRPLSPSSDDVGVNQNDAKVVVVLLDDSDTDHVRFDTQEGGDDGEEGQ